MLRISALALVAIGLLAGAIAAPSHAAAPTKGGVEELWKQFPLDGERDAPVAREVPSEQAGTAKPSNTQPVTTPSSTTPSSMTPSSTPPSSTEPESAAPTNVQPSSAKPEAQSVVPPPIAQTGDEGAAIGASTWIALAAGFALLLAGVVPMLIGAARARSRVRRSVRSPRPASRKASRPLAISADPPTLSGRRVDDDLVRVVDELLGAVSAARSRHEPGEAKMLETSEPSSNASEGATSVTGSNAGVLADQVPGASDPALEKKRAAARARRAAKRARAASAGVHDPSR